MRVLTAAEADGMAARAAAGLSDRGLVAGDRFAIVLPGHGMSRQDAAHVQALVLGLVLGGLRTGVVPVMVNPELAPAEREYILEDSEPGLVVDDLALARSLVESGASSPDLADVPLGRAMHYTSGTTGRPKGVWTSVLPEHDAARWWGDEQDLWGFTREDRMLVHGPLAHTGPLRFAISALLAGGEVVLPGKFDAAEFVVALAQLRPTVAFTVPSHLQRVLDLGPPPSPYRQLMHSGAACPEPLKRRIHDWAGVDRVWEFYGSTEGQFTACPGREWEQRPGTVGRARKGRRITIDSESRIWCHTPDYSRFSYWRDEAKTAEAWQGSAFTVGDLGHVDADDYLYIDGRRSDLIVTGGVNVYPTEVERVLMEFDGVDDVAVFGVPDPEWGHRVCAALVGDIEAERFVELARQGLAGFQRPKSVFRMSALPMTNSGKVQRFALVDMVVAVESPTGAQKSLDVWGAQRLI